MSGSAYHEHLQPGGNRRQHRSEGGFSLIELIGVMAVAAILASVILPSVIRQIQLQAAKTENVFLETIGNALKAHLRRNKTFPDENTWAQIVSTELGVPASEIEETPQQGQRVYVIDPLLRLGAEEETLPFTQTAAGSIEPVSPRVMILSSLDGHKLIPVSNGVIDASDFDILWNLPDGSVPPSWSALWQRSQDDLKVQRINLAPLFHKIIVNNYDSINPGSYSVDDGLAQLIPAEGVSSFFLEGTVLGLHDSGGNLETRQIVRRPCAFTFERETWRGQVFQGLKLSGDDLYSSTSLFAASPQNSQAQSGATPGGVIDAMKDYMERYAEWDSANFPGSGTTRDAIEAAQSTLESVSNQLIYSPLP